MEGVTVKVVSCGYRQPSKGNAGLRCQVPGGMVSVSNLAGATGGIGAGHLAETANGGCTTIKTTPKQTT